MENDDSEESKTPSKKRPQSYVNISKRKERKPLSDNRLAAQKRLADQKIAWRREIYPELTAGVDDKLVVSKRLFMVKRKHPDMLKADALLQRDFSNSKKNQDNLYKTMYNKIAEKQPDKDSLKPNTSPDEHPSSKLQNQQRRHDSSSDDEAGGSHTSALITNRTILSTQVRQQS